MGTLASLAWNAPPANEVSGRSARSAPLSRTQ
jgi:hypothetical protein